MAEMSSTRRRRQKPSQASTLTRSLSPDCYIDLTVDSPVRTPVQANIVEFEDELPVIRISRISTSPSWTIEELPARISNHEDLPGSTRTIRRLSIDQIDHIGIALNDNNNIRENVPNETVIIDDIDAAPVVSVKNSPKVQDKSAASCLSCPICFEELLNTSITAYTTKCGHIFCETCLKKATETRKKCPMCLKAVNLKQCVRLHI